MAFTSAISWFEIPVSEMDRAEKFYQAIFDVKLTPMELPDLEMRMFPLEDPAKGTGGALVFSKDFYKPSSTDGVLIYLNANPDVQQVLDKVEKEGGKIAVPKTQISEEYGYMAVIIDTEGNRIGLHSLPEKYLNPS